MLHLSIVIADLGRFAHLGGAVVRTPSAYLVIEDHHLRPAERVQFVERNVDLTDVTDVDVTVITDLDLDCSADLHEWHVVELTETGIEVHCRRCDISERTHRLPYWTGAIHRVPPLSCTTERGTLDHGMG